MSLALFGRRRLALAAAALVAAACESTPARVVAPPDRPSLAAVGSARVQFSEIHYDNASTDVNEAIEISGPAGTSLAGWSIVLYNGSSNPAAVYNTRSLSGTIPATCGERGVVVFTYPANGIQNGDPDGFALVNGDGAVVEFLSYGGVVTGAAGSAAAGMTSTNIGVKEGASTPVGHSLARNTADVWQAPAANSFGACNDGGTTTPAGPATSVAVSPATTSVNVGATRQFSASARDANDAAVTTTYTWASLDASIATVDGTGLATGVAQGTTTITATSANGVVGQATLTVTAAPAPGAVASVSIGGRAADDPRLSPTFYDQFFATARDANGAIVQTTFTWGTTTPALITVDQRGNVGALAVGNAVITATSQDGRTGTFNLTIVPGTPSGTASYLGNAEFGEPTDADASDDFVIRRAQYTTSYNRARGGPNWVSYNLEPSHFGASDRCDCFSPEPLLPTSFPQILTTDYTNGSYDRGHMVRSADRTAADYDNATTFYFSNILPQAPDNNQGPWAVLEDSLGRLAKRGDREVYVITGGAGSLGTLKNEGKVVIPARTWKIAVVLRRDEGVDDVRGFGDVLDVIATDFPNIQGIRGVSWTSYKTTVDAIETLTGYDFLAALPDDIEAALEAQQPGVRAVDMDVQPQQISVSTTATVNVVLLSSEGFDAQAVNAANVRLVVNGGASVAPIMRGAVVNTSVRDVNGDGRTDRLISFATSALRAAGFAPGASALVARLVTAPTWEARDLAPPTVVP